jgi:homoserine dehydrogenase
LVKLRQIRTYKTIIIEALKAGKNVVTANKAVLAKYWDQIFTTVQAC